MIIITPNMTDLTVSHLHHSIGLGADIGKIVHLLWAFL